MNIKTLTVTITPDRTDVHLLAVREDGELAGIAVVALGKDENSGWLSSVFVQPDHRGHGFGRQLVERATAVCRADSRGFISMNVKKDNEAAKRLYASLGFLPFMDGPEDYTQWLKAL
ncbi:MAG: GNAT family N-acetyltransferase [Hymenobacter sp.]|nr:MAG: GNAT family N-acetyltransferase [Hymenobacter sp.]